MWLIGFVRVFGANMTCTSRMAYRCTPHVKYNSYLNVRTPTYLYIVHSTSLMAVVVLPRSSLARSLLRSATHTCKNQNVKHATREAAFRKVVARADRRYKRVALRALQRWRLAAAAAAMRALRQRQKRKSLERGASLVEALLRRRVKARLLAGFQQWSDADAQVTMSLGCIWTYSFCVWCAVLSNTSYFM